MEKFLRNYELTVEDNEHNFVKITLPFTIQFDVIRNVLTSANTCTFQIYNLSANHRRLLQKNVTDLANVRLIYFRAGYQSRMPLVFAGNIMHAYSVRQGTDFITYIEAFDGGFAFSNGACNLSFPAGYTQSDIIAAIAKTLPYVELGAIGNSYQNVTRRSNSYKGNTVEVISELAGGGFFIDLGRAYALADNECLPSKGIDVIDPSVGLLGTPERDQTNMRFDMLFEPMLRIAQKITLESVTEKYLNGTYKVISLHHRGMVSEAICGDAVTTVGLLAPFVGYTLTDVPEVEDAPL